MIEQLKTISDALDSVLQVLIVLIPTYIVALGLARRSGKQSTLKKKQDEWEAMGLPDPTIKLILDPPQTNPPWTDPSVLLGGFTGLVTVLFWLSFVLVGLLIPYWLPTIPASLQSASDRLAQLVWVPNLMIGLNFAIQTRIIRPQVPLFLPFVAIACVLLSTGIVFFVEESQHIIVVQLVIFLILSFVMSFGAGVTEAILYGYRPDFLRYPMVEVVLNKGNSLGLMRLYQTTPTDYRFVRDDGVEVILPSQQVAEIRYFPSSYSEEKPKNSSYENEVNS